VAIAAIFKVKLLQEYKNTISLVVLQFLNIFNHNALSKNNQIPNAMNIGPVEADLLHLDRPTDKHDKTNSRFS